MIDAMEQSRETKLVKNTIIYTISNFGSKILTFLIVPLYTYYLSTAEFGTYDTVISIVNLLAPMCTLAIHEGLLRWLLKSDEKHEEILGSGLSLLLLFVVVTDLLVYIVCRLLNWEYTVVFIVLMTTNALHNSFQFIARGEKKNKVFAISGVVYTVIMLALNVLFIVYFHWGVNGMLWSIAIAQICVIVYLLWMLRDRLQLKQIRFKKKLALSILSYSIMLVPNNISWWVMNASDRIMLTAMVGAATTGIFSLAHKFPSIVTILHTLFYQAWQEQAILEYDSTSRDSYYTKVFNYYMKLACCAVAVLIPLSKLLIIYCMDQSYMDSFQYVGLLYIGSLFSSFSGFYGIGYISAKNTKGAMETTIIGAVINFLVNLFFIPLIGIWAACLSTVCGNLIVWIIRIVNTRKYFHISVEWKIFMGVMCVNVLFTIAVCFSNTMWTVVMLIMASIVAILVNQEMIVGIFNTIRRKVGFLQ